MGRQKKPVEVQLAEAERRKKFGVRLDRFLGTQEVSQSDICRESGLSPDVVSLMLKGDNGRLTRGYFLQFLTGMVHREICTEEWDAEEWLQEFYEAKGTPEHKRIPLKDLRIEGKAILDLIARKRAIREQEASIEKPKYTTSRGIPVIGRDEDIKEILRRLQKGEQFIGIVGLPGVGKSELARQVREETKTQGIFTSVLDPLSLVQGTTPDAVITLLTPKLKRIPKQVKTLITLEDCEQVKPVKGLIRALQNFLDNHKHVSILATSQKKMTENDYTVQTLKAPKRIDESPETLQKYDAIRLFLVTANHNKEGNEVLLITKDNAKTIASLCRALDGIPLMLRHAALMVRKLKGVGGVYSYLKAGHLQGVGNPIIDEEEWHVSINTVLERSYDLLEKEEYGKQKQALFRRLAIFVGKCGIETAMNVCKLENNLSTEIASFTTIVNALNDYFLITLENERIAIAHNTLRDFAMRKLKEKKEEEKIRKQLIDYYETLVAAYMELVKSDVTARGMEKKDLQQRLDEYWTIFCFEYANLAAVSEYSIEVILDLVETLQLTDQDEERAIQAIQTKIRHIRFIKEKVDYWWVLLRRE